EAMLAAARPAGDVPVPGRARRADLTDSAFLGGTAAHGIELDDGYTKGSAHPGCTVVPAALAPGLTCKADGQALIDAVGAGRGAAGARLLALPAPAIAHAFGIAASGAAGLFAFVNGGADIKRLHAGHASREGLQAALLAREGVEGPPGVLEARDGFLQAFAFG